MRIRFPDDPDGHVRDRGSPKLEGRKKSEGRRPKEVRRQKAEIRSGRSSVLVPGALNSRAEELMAFWIILLR